MCEDTPAGSPSVLVLSSHVPRAGRPALGGSAGAHRRSGAVLAGVPSQLRGARLPAEPGARRADGAAGQVRVLHRSRSVLGDVPAEVVAAAFAVFNPDEIVPLVRRGQALADAATVWAARLDGAAAQLRRILDATPDRVEWVSERLLAAAEDLPLAGRAFFAAQRAAAIPDDPIARLWRSADRLREFRGDSHIQVWSAAGFDPLEIGLLSDLFWGLAPRAHTAGRGWTVEQLAAGEARLRARGLLDARRPADRRGPRRARGDRGAHRRRRRARHRRARRRHRRAPRDDRAVGPGHPRRRRLPHPAGPIHVRRPTMTAREAVGTRSPASVLAATRSS